MSFFSQQLYAESLILYGHRTRFVSLLINSKNVRHAQLERALAHKADALKTGHDASNCRKLAVVHLLRATERHECRQYVWQLRFGVRLGVDACGDLRQAHRQV